MAQVRYTRNLFLRGISIIYLFAFLGFYIQIPGEFYSIDQFFLFHIKHLFKFTNWIQQ